MMNMNQNPGPVNATTCKEIKIKCNRLFLI